MAKIVNLSFASFWPNETIPIFLCVLCGQKNTSLIPARTILTRKFGQILCFKVYFWFVCSRQ